MCKFNPVVLLVVCCVTAVAFGQAEDPQAPADAEKAAKAREQAATEAEAEAQERAEEAAGGAAADEAEEQADEKLSGRKRQNRSVQAQLDRSLPEISFDGVGLSDVLDFLRDVTNANLFVNWRTLEEAGIDRNATVNARMKNVKFGKALQVILDGVGGKKGKLAFEIDDGVITISTAADLGLNYHTRSYDVRDILEAAADKGATAGKAVDGGKHAEGGKGAEDEGVAKAAAEAGTEADAKADAARAKRLETLKKLITGSVAPESWHHLGGNVGTVHETEGRLVITQAPESHDAIANLLNQTRALLGLKPAEKPAPVVEEPQE